MADDTKQATAPTPEQEQSDKLRIEQLVRENKKLAEDLRSAQALLKEQDDAIKAARTKKANEPVPTVAKALRRMLVGDRKFVEIGDTLSKVECEALTAGEHYELVPVA